MGLLDSRHLAALPLRVYTSPAGPVVIPASIVGRPIVLVTQPPTMSGQVVRVLGLPAGVATPSPGFLQRSLESH